MALTKDQQAAQIKRAKAKLAKAEKAVADIDALKREIEWLEQAPIVEKPKRAAKKVAPAAQAPASA